MKKVLAIPGVTNKMSTIGVTKDRTALGCCQSSGNILTWNSSSKVKRDITPLHCVGEFGPTLEDGEVLTMLPMYMEKNFTIVALGENDNRSSNI